MRYIKSFRFWLTLSAVCFCLNNYFGNDDKNLLLFFTSPPMWLLEDYSYIFRKYFGKEGAFIFWYVLHAGFWYVVGLYLDRKILKGL